MGDGPLPGGVGDIDGQFGSADPEGGAADDLIVEDGDIGGANPAASSLGETSLLGHLRSQVERLERLVSVPEHLVRREIDSHLIPAWKRATEGEAPWPVAVAIGAAIVLQLTLPGHLAVSPVWLLPSIEAVMLVGLALANPGRISQRSARFRGLMLALVVVASFANAWSAGHLARGLIRGTEGLTAGRLLAVGGAIWFTNVVVFALWYWQYDRGGPVARAMGTKPYPDFLFAEMQSPEMAPPDWEPSFVDYFYLSFTNATAFSPTDTLPLTRWSKLTMMAQSSISLITVALVVARAVNILG